MEWLKEVRARTPIRSNSSDSVQEDHISNNNADIVKRSSSGERSENMCSSTTLSFEDHIDGSPKSTQTKEISSVWDTVISTGNLYLHVSYERKILYYFASLLLFSWMKATETPHVDFLTGKHSILNQVFVKLGWAWTLGVFAVYRLLSLSVDKEWRSTLKKLCLRFAVTTFFFYIWCAIIFPAIEAYTGACLLKKIRTDLPKRECLKRKYEYISFDISGHSYLLTYCVLILMEESKESINLLKIIKNDIKDGNIVERFHLMAPFICLAYFWLSDFQNIEEKMGNIYSNINEVQSRQGTIFPDLPFSKLSEFEQSSLEELERILLKATLNTESDPFPIIDLSTADNFEKLLDAYHRITNQC
ncbi:hypothetical protein SK128_020059 [Halocaridina rubra]|uniref:Uncharacterized protein n=1 Tax=Halocaridina rubra TaxID=373956 RepID=A0AAN9A7M3_HALRR